VLDNHTIFGGEATRNEFLFDGHVLTTHQGSAIFLVPEKGGYTDRVYDMIGMDRSTLEYQRWRGPSPEMPLSQSPYETPKNYGFYFGTHFGKQRATESGARILVPLENQFWGDRIAWFMDPAGQVWTVATRIEQTTAEERTNRWDTILARGRAE
jgi:hypothetical protein